MSRRLAGAEVAGGRGIDLACRRAKLLLVGRARFFSQTKLRVGDTPRKEKSMLAKVEETGFRANIRLAPDPYEPAASSSSSWLHVEGDEHSLVEGAPLEESEDIGGSADIDPPPGI